MATLETHRMQDVVKGMRTVSDKIRALDAAGYARADIARFLGKRYQHVRNVLVASTPGTNRSGSRMSAVETDVRAMKSSVIIGAGGRIVIPADMRAQMHADVGDTLMAKVVDGELRLMSQASALRKARTLVRQHLQTEPGLVEEFLEDRRAEAAREREG